MSEGFSAELALKFWREGFANKVETRMGGEGVNTTVGKEVGVV